MARTQSHSHLASRSEHAVKSNWTIAFGAEPFLTGLLTLRESGPCRDRDFVAFEPMTAPTDALSSGRGLRVVDPGGELRAEFEVRVEDDGR